MWGHSAPPTKEEPNKREVLVLLLQLGCLLNPIVGSQLVCPELLLIAQVPVKGQSGVSRHNLQPVQRPAVNRQIPGAPPSPKHRGGLQVLSANPTTSDSKCWRCTP